MPRRSRGPHLYLKRRTDGGASFWYLRDGDRRIPTGSREDDASGARAFLGAYASRAAISTFGSSDPAQVKVAAVIALYAKDKADSVARPKEALARWARLNDAWGNYPVSAINPILCREYVRARGSVQAARRELQDGKAILNYAWNNRQILYPIPIELPPKAAPRERWLSRSEASRFLLGALGFELGQFGGGWRIVGRPGKPNYHVAHFFLIGLYTGTRHGNILDLGWRRHLRGGYVDLDAGLIYRQAPGRRETKKRAPPVAIPDRLAAHLRRWAKKPTAGLYVVSWDGSRLGKMRRAWKSACKLAGLGDDVTPHVLRHTFVSWQLQSGESHFNVARRAGMTIEMVDKVYGHHSTARRQAK